MTKNDNQLTHFWFQAVVKWHLTFKNVKEPIFPQFYLWNFGINYLYDRKRQKLWQFDFSIKKIFLGNLSIFIKLFENIFCCLSNASNGTFWKFSKILPIFRDICQNRFLYKPKIAFLRKLNDGILMLRKDNVLSL